ncbi:hypothetical protein ACJMK2_004690 [Sinanodonta woodiana]|uniref:Bromo domain-containing protein n=1 Tax=Sinanodonta woodiana TaxID=1069815 RepID=A0ABD3VMT2_SINWO
MERTVKIPKPPRGPVTLEQLGAHHHICLLKEDIACMLTDGVSCSLAVQLDTECVASRSPKVDPPTPLSPPHILIAYPLYSLNQVASCTPHISPSHTEIVLPLSHIPRTAIAGETQVPTMKKRLFKKAKSITVSSSSNNTTSTDIAVEPAVAKTKKRIVTTRAKKDSYPISISSSPTSSTSPPPAKPLSPIITVLPTSIYGSVFSLNLEVDRPASPLISPSHTIFPPHSLSSDTELAPISQSLTLSPPLKFHNLTLRLFILCRTFRRQLWPITDAKSLKKNTKTISLPNPKSTIKQTKKSILTTKNLISPKSLDVNREKHKVRKINKSNGEDRSAICYICYKRVFHLDTHLNRACFPKHGYTQPERLRILAEQKKRQRRWLNSCVTESSLYRDSVIGNDSEAYLNVNYVIDLLYQNGVLVCRDLYDKGIINKVKQSAVSLNETAQDISKLPEAPSSPSVTPIVPNVTINLTSAGSSVVGPLTQKLISQMFDEEEEDHPAIEMTFLEDTDGDDQPVISVKSVSSSQWTSSDVIPLARLQTGSSNKLLQFSNVYKNEISRIGFGNKFKLESSPILNKYHSYLVDTLKLGNKMYINALVNNVNKILYFFHPDIERIEALCETQRIRPYFRQLPEELTFEGYNNYVKSLFRFLNFCENSADIKLNHPSLISNVPVIRHTLNDVRIKMSEFTRKRKADTKDDVQLEKSPKSKKIKVDESETHCFNALVNSIVPKFNILADDEMPSFAEIRNMAIENNPGVKLDKPMITRIRDRLKYQRSLLHVSDAIARFFSREYVPQSTN